jgi:uncharacterized membrane protein YraQ (UPF0718 family)
VSASTTTLECNPAIAKASNWRSQAIAIVLMGAIAGIFWVDSRYPSLLKKYRSGAQVKVVGAITFDAVYQVDRTMPLGQRVWRTSVNWLNANRIGMTFAFCFGPAALTFLALLPRRRTRSRHLNALIGTLTGMPLAVCANCVAPIGRGLYASGMSTESVLAAMFSSPTLNIVVLAMTFALFPLSVALVKLATVLLLIFGFAPYIAARQGAAAEAAPECPVEIALAETWAQALERTLAAYAKSFWYVFRAGFPLMLLGAALGALMIEALPQQALNAPVTLGGIALVALVGALLPVPMAFDVVIAYIAMTKGVPLPYVVTILCTLGVYSVYSLSVVGKTISWKVATAAYAAVALLGALAGLAARALELATTGAYLASSFLCSVVHTETAVLGSTALSPSSICWITPFLSMTMFARIAHS